MAGSSQQAVGQCIRRLAGSALVYEPLRRAPQILHQHYSQGYRDRPLCNALILSQATL
jgi:hypothetical protein